MPDHFSPEVEALLRRIAKDSAAEALADLMKQLDLNDENAGRDMRDMRDLLSAFRDTRHTISSTFIRLVTTAVLGFIALAVWVATKGSLLK